MPYGYTHAHCEWLASYAYADEVGRPSSFEVLLYDDETDELGFTADLADIETEPSDGSYERATLSFPSDIGVVLNPQWVAAKPLDATFNMQGVTGRVDSVGIAWEAELYEDDAPTTHLMVRQELDEPRHLDEIEGTYPVEAAWQLLNFE